MNFHRKCSLCTASAGRLARRLHPLLPLRTFVVCARCDSVLRRRLVDAGCTLRHPEANSANQDAADSPRNKSSQLSSARKSTAPGVIRGTHTMTIPAPPVTAAVEPPLTAEQTQWAGRLVALAEELVWSARGDPEAAAVRARVRQDASSGAAKPLPPLGIERSVISIARAVFSAVGVRLVDGRLQFPVGPVALPPLDDAYAAVEGALLPFGMDTRSGADVWDATFPECNWAVRVPLRMLHVKLFSLFGIRTAPPLRVSRRRAVEHLALDGASVTCALTAATRIAQPALKSVLQPPGEPLPPHLLHAASAFQDALALNGRPKRNVCACCGCAYNSSAFPFKFGECVECEKQICSMCLMRVFGPAEHARAFCGKFRCPSCRIMVSVSMQGKRDAPLAVMREKRAKSLQARLKAAITGDGKIAKKPWKSQLPLLIVARAVALSIQGFDPISEEARPNVGFAKLCDDINFATRTFPGGSAHDPSDLGAVSTTVCVACCVPLGVACGGDTAAGMDFTFPVYKSGAAKSGLVICSDKSCDVAVHASCAQKSPAHGDPLSTNFAGWKCGRHACIKCGSDAVEVRCRTCTVSYCGDHAPSRDDIHQHSTEWISCAMCKPLLDVPRFPHEADANVDVKPGSSALRLADAFRREQGFGVVHVNSLVDMHNVADVRDPVELRAAIAKCKYYRHRRVYRDSEKRNVAQEIQAAGGKKSTKISSKGKPKASSPNKPNEPSPAKPSESSCVKPKATSPSKSTEPSPSTSKEASPAIPVESFPAKLKAVSPATPIASSLGGLKPVSLARRKSLSPAKSKESSPSNPKEISLGKPKRASPVKSKGISPSKSPKLRENGRSVGNGGVPNGKPRHGGIAKPKVKSNCEKRKSVAEILATQDWNPGRKAQGNGNGSSIVAGTSIPRRNSGSSGPPAANRMYRNIAPAPSFEGLNNVINPDTAAIVDPRTRNNNDFGMNRLHNIASLSTQMNVNPRRNRWDNAVPEKRDPRGIEIPRRWSKEGEKAVEMRYGKVSRFQPRIDPVVSEPHISSNSGAILRAAPQQSNGSSSLGHKAGLQSSIASNAGVPIVNAPQIHLENGAGRESHPTPSKAQFPFRSRPNGKCK